MIRKKLVQVGKSKAIIIPSSYLYYWKMQGKNIREFDISINKKIILSPIFEEIDETKVMELGEISNEIT